MPKGIIAAIICEVSGRWAWLFSCLPIRAKGTADDTTPTRQRWNDGLEFAGRRGRGRACDL